MFTALKKLVKKFRKSNKYESTFYNEPGVPRMSSGFATMNNATTMYTTLGVSGETQAAPVDAREVKKPVDVFHEILIEQPMIDLVDIDHKIKTVKRRINVLKEQSVNLSDETEALGYLLARKQYNKVKDLFKWKVTTDEKIKELLSKYKLMQVSFQGYAKNVPNEALDEIEQFAEAYERVSDRQPNLQLIVDYEGPEHKKDPILLARSPFGRWWYVLGAWDKEVEYVDDLIYKGK